ncbi:helix-turn-helix domain-containing protein [Streptomyces melanogenes]|uniref:Helix-turn-helix domain-containing protein n=1 Tax=Streptomyces melanogenes TaxID=67326 RepID=A0ABZ1XDK8_9ACTN|nr:helix-turn-helix domain-containing protein [Streptomyces melanogenes]
MARPEKPLDPDAGPVAHFAETLRQLRHDARLSYRAMAQKTGYSLSSLSQTAAGRKLPSLAITLAYVEACGGERAVWEEHWHQTEQAVRNATSAARSEQEDGPVPYRGLARYESADSALFFGRGALTDQLVNLVARQRVSVVVGPSGSGKSSLLRAGLIPRLQDPDPTTGELRVAALRICTPGPRPMSEHEKLFTPRDTEAARGADGDTLVIVDQFEEVFTLCTDADERAAFLDLILAAQDPGSRLRVVLGVRADFYTHCLRHPRLAQILREAGLPVGPMSPDEVRQAITKPAAARGAIVERVLTTRLVEAVSAEPGALPLMSHALLETWRHRTGRALTLEAYEAAGGLDGAVAATAENLYTSLDDHQATLVRQILLRLITPGDGTPDTRRPIPHSEVEADRPGETTPVLEQLARARLITLDDDQVDLAHEALITAWPRLAGWIDEDRDRLRLHRQLTDTTHTWQQHDRDRGALLRGGRLEAVWNAFGADSGAAELTSVEREFLTASWAAATRERRLRQTAVAVLAVLVVLALVAAGLAWGQRKDTLAAQRQAQSRQLALQSDALLARNPDAAALLAVAAYRVSPTDEATVSLHAAAALPLKHRIALGDASTRALSLAFSPDGKTVAVGGIDGMVRLWDTATGRSRPLTKPQRGAYSVNAMMFSADGHTLATAIGRTVRLWDTVSGRIRSETSSDGRVRGETSGEFLRTEGVSFARDGHSLVLSDSKGTVRHWDPAAGHVRTLLAATPDPTVAALSPDGSTIAVGSEDGAVRLREVASGRTGQTLTGSPGSVSAVGVSPDGRTVAVGYANGSVRLWEPNSGRVRDLAELPATVQHLAFSTDGRTLAASTQGSSTIVNDEGWTVGVANGRDAPSVWDVASGRRVTTLTGHTGEPEALAVSPDGHAIATSSSDGAVRLWDVTDSRHTYTLLTNSLEPVYSLALSPDGQTLATADTSIRLWDTASGHLRRTMAPARRLRTAAFAFGPDGRTLIASARDAVQLWDVASSAVRATIREANDFPGGLTVGPDGRLLAINGDGPKVDLWDTTTGRRQSTLAREGTRGPVMALSADGRTLAAVDDKQADLWDTATGQRRATLTGATGTSLAFSPDSRTLATRAGRSVRLRDATTGRIRVTLPPFEDPAGDLVFSPDSRTLATRYGNGVRLWDTATGRSRGVLTGHSDQLEQIAFSPDSRTLATASDDGTVRLWDVATGLAYATLTGHTRAVTHVLFGNDGHTLFTAGLDRTVRQWGIQPFSPHTAIRIICTALGRELTQAEQTAYTNSRPVPTHCAPTSP